jgi:formylglycine-generating enzyme required for sulfatase activity
MNRVDFNVSLVAGALRVNRGGSWLNSPRYVRVALRSGYTPALRSYYLGLRLARNGQ